MVRRFSIAMILAAIPILAGDGSRARGQYAIRGGPVYSGPVYGGPFYGGPINPGAVYTIGPSINVGAYAPTYYPNPPYGPAGAGFGSTYISAVPYANIGTPITVTTVAPRPPYMPAEGNSGYPAQQTNPPPPPPPGPTTPQGPMTPPPGAPGVPATPLDTSRTTPGTPANPPAAPPGTPTDTTRPASGTPAGPGAAPVTPATPPGWSEPAKPATITATSKRAHFTVKLPVDAKLWVNDVETQTTGTSRRFHSPATLEPGKAYEYTFRAQWIEGGQIVTRDRTLRFKAGEDVDVDFTQAAAR